jgi:hypothetical protein
MHRPVADAIASVLNASSEVYSGATLTFYSLADALQDVYTDTDWVTPASTAGVLTANSAGRFPKAFFRDDLNYKATLKDSGGSTIATINPIYKSAGFLDSTDLTGYLQKSGGTMTGALNFAEGAGVASATTVDLDAATGNFIHITGTTTIAGLTLASGAMRWVVFDGIVTLTHSSSLVLPGSLNITTVAGDCALFVGEGSGVTRLLWYRCVDGTPLVEGADILIGIGNESTAITTGTSKITFRMPFAMTLTEVRASLTAAQATGSIVTIDINESGSTILSTKITIDNTELTSETADADSVISDTSLAENAVMTVDIDQCDGSTAAAGLKILLKGYRRNR